MLDAGCGRGRNARFLKQFGADIICADTDARALRVVLDSRYALWPPEAAHSGRREGSGRLAPIQVNLRSCLWPFRRDVFNLILSIDFLDMQLLDAFAYSLKRGGLLLIETISGRGGNYLKLPHRGELRSTLDQKFDVRIYREMSAGPPGQNAVTVRTLAIRH